MPPTPRFPLPFPADPYSPREAETGNAPVPSISVIATPSASVLVLRRRLGVRAGGKFRARGVELPARGRLSLARLGRLAARRACQRRQHGRVVRLAWRRPATVRGLQYHGALARGPQWGCRSLLGVCRASIRP